MYGPSLPTPVADRVSKTTYADHSAQFSHVLQAPLYTLRAIRLEERYKEETALPALSTAYWLTPSALHLWVDTPTSATLRGR